MVTQPYISVIIPVYNEKINVKILHEKLVDVLQKLTKKYEIIYVDDGSTDSTFRVLSSFSHTKVIRFSKNFGQTAALSAGFDEAKGKIIISMDADMQNDPDDIPNFLQKIEEGYDIVCGWRSQRHDPLVKKIPSKIANLIISKVSGIGIHDFGCTLKAYKSEVVKSLNLYGDMHRFIPAVASSGGWEITELVIKHHERKFGKSKYGLSRTTKAILDLITVKFFLSYSSKPMQILGLIGIILGGIGFFTTLLLVLERTIYRTPLFNSPFLF